MIDKRPTTQDRLQRYANLVQEIDNQIERLEIMEEKLGSPASSNLTGMPKSGSGCFDRMAMAIARKEELEQQIKRLISKERAEAQEIKEAMDLLENLNEKDVILMRYVDGLPWTEICEALFDRQKDYQKRADTFLRKTFKIHKKALENLEAATTPPEDQENGPEKQTHKK